MREPGGAQLRDRQPAGCQHQRLRSEAAMVRIHAEAVRTAQRGDAMGKPDIHPGGAAFRQQHRDDGPCGAVAEQLTQCLFMAGDAMAADEGGEIILCVAGQG